MDSSMNEVWKDILRDREALEEHNALFADSKGPWGAYERRELVDLLANLHRRLIRVEDAVMQKQPGE